MVSVVIPAYNAKKYIIDAVNSAILQKDARKEIIIIDDGSTDRVVEYLIGCLMRDYQVSDVVLNIRENETDKLYLIWQAVIYDTPIRIYRSPVNKGVATSRNMGVKVAKGKYIAFLDADDFWHRDKLRLQLEVMEKHNAVLCCTGRLLFNERGRMLGKYIGTPDIITLKKLEKTNYINCSSVLVKRDVMLKYPMKVTEAHEDYLCWLCLMKEHDIVFGIDRPLLYYRVRKSSVSGNKLKSAKMTYLAYKGAGYKNPKAIFMMISYMFNGIKKYTNNSK